MKAGTTKGGGTNAGTAKGGRRGVVPRRAGVRRSGRAASGSSGRARVSSVQICIFIHGEITVPKWLSMDWREPFLEGQRIPRNVGKVAPVAIERDRAWPARAGVRRAGRAACDSLGLARPRDHCENLYLYSRWMPLPKGPSKDWREPFLEGPADTLQRAESGASGHRAGCGLTGKTGGRWPGSAASDSLRLPRSQNAPAGAVVHICIFILYCYVHFVSLSAVGLPC